MKIFEYADGTIESPCPKPCLTTNVIFKSKKGSQLNKLRSLKVAKFKDGVHDGVCDGDGDGVCDSVKVVVYWID